MLAEKTFSTTPSEKSTNVTSWKLDAPVKARALRVESANPSQPLALTEVEAYGPEDAEDTPAPAPAENNYPRSPAPAPEAMLKTAVSFPLPGKQVGAGPDGMSRAKFRDWLRV